MGARKPNLYVFAERFVQTIKLQCLDHSVSFGGDHYRYIANRFVTFFHHERPHQGLDNERIMAKPAEETDDVIFLELIRCSTRIRELLKSYSRKAA